MMSLSNFPYFGFDTETTGLQYKVDRVFGFSVATPDGNTLYFDIREQPKAVKWLNDEMRHYRGTVIAHNASFDYRMSNHTGIHLPLERMDDTVIRACNIDENLHAYDLDSLLWKYLKKRKYTEIYEELAQMFGGKPTKNVQMPNLQRAPSGLVAKYAEPDAEGTLLLWEWQEKEIKRQGLQDVMKFERDRIPTFIRAEMRGIRVNRKYAAEAADKLTPMIDGKQRKLNRLASTEVNVNSAPQVKKLFSPKQVANGDWIASDGTVLEKTPKGAASLGADALRIMKDEKAELILDIRSLIKTRDTFLRGHVIGSAVKDRVYPTINQSKGENGGTETGRLSIVKPALQQIPSRNKEVAMIVKPCFLPDVGMVWVDTDMASFEVRVFYDLIKNPNIIRLYKKDPGKDAHQIVADLTGLVRNATYSGQPNAKQLNLSMIFNSGDGAIADKMGMPWEWEEFVLSYGREAGKKIRYKKAGIEAMRVINQYHRQVPGVKALAEKCQRIAEDQGYITTFTGRRIHFPNGQHAWAASGKLIQATAADLNKQNWSIIEEELGDIGHLILNVHDSYGLNMPRYWKTHFKRVKAAIERPRLDIPLVMDLNGAGRNWWEAIK